MAQENRDDIIQALRHCHDTCLEAFAIHCTKVGGNHMAREHMRRMQSAIELCDLTANFLLRRSPLTHDLCSLTADICRQTAASCDGMDDRHMNQCVRACEAATNACLHESLYLKAIAA